MVDAKTIATYDARAGDYVKLTQQSVPDAALQSFIDMMPTGARVLDLGCGPAMASVHMRRAGLVPDPVDASPGMVALANETHDINARLSTFDDINVVEFYDGIWANFSLLHAPRGDLPGHLAALFRALKSGGIFHIGMKTGEGSARDGIDRLYTYVTVAELADLLHAAGFRVLHTTEGAERGLAGTIDPFVIMQARKDG